MTKNRIVLLFALSPLLFSTELSGQNLKQLKWSARQSFESEVPILFAPMDSDPVGINLEIVKAFDRQGLALPLLSSDPEKNLGAAKYINDNGILILSMTSYQTKADWYCPGGSNFSSMRGAIYVEQNGEVDFVADFTFGQSIFSHKCIGVVLDDLVRRIRRSFILSPEIQLNGFEQEQGEVENRGIDETALRASIEAVRGDSIEGVYTSMVGEEQKCSSYRLGILYSDSLKVLESIVLEEQGLFAVGDIKAELRTTAAEGFYLASWYGANKLPIDAMAEFSNGILTFTFEDQVICRYVKLWPN